MVFSHSLVGRISKKKKADDAPTPPAERKPIYVNSESNIFHR